jgi:hypothetical protein
LEPFPFFDFFALLEPLIFLGRSVLSDGLELTKAFPLIPVRVILNEESLFTDGMLTDGTLLKEGLTLTDG